MGVKFLSIDKDTLKRIKANQDSKGNPANKSNTNNNGNSPNTIKYDYNNKGSLPKNPNLSNRRNNSDPHNFRQSID